MRRQFKPSDDYAKAPDTIGVYVLGFNLPELADEKMFVSRIVRANYDSGKHFLPDKYSDYYIELTKHSKFEKSELSAEHHEIWEICVILKTKIKDQEDVIKMQGVQSPIALDLAKETKKAVAPDEFVNDALRREQGLNEIQAFIEREKQKTAEEMILIALQRNAPPDLVETMRKGVGITDARFAELKKQAQLS
jgi:hypothetical protein